MHTEIPTVCADEAHAEYIDGQAAKASNNDRGADRFDLFLIRVLVGCVGDGQPACAREYTAHNTQREENHPQYVLARHLQKDTCDMNERTKSLVFYLFGQQFIV